MIKKSFLYMPVLIICISLFFLTTIPSAAAESAGGFTWSKNPETGTITMEDDVLKVVWGYDYSKSSTFKNRGGGNIYELYDKRNVEAELQNLVAKPDYGSQKTGPLYSGIGGLGSTFIYDWAEYGTGSATNSDNGCLAEPQFGAEGPEVGYSENGGYFYVNAAYSVYNDIDGSCKAQIDYVVDKHWKVYHDGHIDLDITMEFPRAFNASEPSVNFSFSQQYGWQQMTALEHATDDEICDPAQYNGLTNPNNRYFQLRNIDEGKDYDMALLHMQEFLLHGQNSDPNQNRSAIKLTVNENNGGFEKNGTDGIFDFGVARTESTEHPLGNPSTEYSNYRHLAYGHSIHVRAWWGGASAPPNRYFEIPAGSSFTDTYTIRMLPSDPPDSDPIFSPSYPLIHLSVPERISDTFTGDNGDGTSADPSMTPDGRLVVFSSNAYNLLPLASHPELSCEDQPEETDCNREMDVFMSDASTLPAVVSRLSDYVSEGGQVTPANGASSKPDIAEDGSVAVFSSTATNLEDGIPSCDPVVEQCHKQIIVHDLINPSNSVVSTSPSGVWGNGPSNYASSSADGRFVVFHSYANNLVCDPVCKGGSSIYVKDTTDDANGQIIWIGYGTYEKPSISQDGLYVAFTSKNPTDNSAQGAENIYIKKIRDDVNGNLNPDGQLMLVSTTPEGITSGASKQTSLSHDGRYVAFSSTASLDGNSIDNSAGSSDVFLKRIINENGVLFNTETAQRASVAGCPDSCTLADGGSDLPTIGEHNGQVYVAFRSLATNLVGADDTNQKRDIFEYTLGGSVTRVSTKSLKSVGVQSEGDSNSPVMKIDESGTRRIAMQSYGSLVPGDGGGWADIFVKNTSTNDTISVSSVGLDGVEGNNASKTSSVSADGRFVVFDSLANNLVAGDENDNFNDVYLRDKTDNGQVWKLSNSTLCPYACDDPYISSDGKYVTFTVYTTTGTSMADIYRIPITNEGSVSIGDPEKVSVHLTGAAPNGKSMRSSITSDGKYVAFQSWATNLVSGDANNSEDIFVRDMDLEKTVRVSGSGCTRISGEDLSKCRSWNAQIAGPDETNVYAVVFASHNEILGPGARWDIFKANVYSDAVQLYANPRELISFDSVSSPGNNLPADGDSDSPSVSGDGRFVVFHSAATNLAGNGNDTNGYKDIYLKDTDSGATKIVSTNWFGAPALGSPGNFAGDSVNPFISEDGRYVAFSSGAWNLDPQNYTNQSQIYIKDNQNGKIRSISTDHYGRLGGGTSVSPALSADGQWATFSTWAMLLPEDDTGSNTTGWDIYQNRNDIWDDEVFLGDFLAPTIENLTPSDSVTAGNIEISADYSDSNPSTGIDTSSITVTMDSNVIISCTANASHVTCPVGGVSDGSHSITVSVSDNADNSATASGSFTVSTTLRTSTSSAGTGSSGLVSMSDLPSVSADGRYVAFTSPAADLGLGGDNNHEGVALKDTATGKTQLVSIGQYTDLSEQPDLSADGRYVVFVSGFDSEDPGDPSVTDPAVYRRDMNSQQIDSLPAYDDCFLPSVSDDGKKVAYQCTGNSAEQQDSNNKSDIYMKDFDAAGIPTRVSTKANGEQASGGGANPSISSEGRYVAFESGDSDIVAGDTNAKTDIFLKDTVDGTVWRVSTGLAGVQPNGGSTNASVSADGAYVVFESAASNLVDGDTNWANDIFVMRRSDGVITRISTDANGAQANGASNNPSISDDATKVVFSSAANNLVATDTNGYDDIFVKNLNGPITISSRKSDGSQSMFGAVRPCISGNGASVAFASYSMLIPDDQWATMDIYYKPTG